LVFPAEVRADADSRKRRFRAVTFATIPASTYPVVWPTDVLIDATQLSLC
jgi:hypothetical protein